MRTPTSHENELAGMERLAKKAAASALRKKKAEEKKKKEEDERIILASILDKEAKDKEEYEKKALEDEEIAVNKSKVQNTLTKDIIDLNDMTDADSVEAEEVNMDLFKNDDEEVEEDDPKSPAYKKTRGLTSSLKST